VGGDGSGVLGELDDEDGRARVRRSDLPVSTLAVVDLIVIVWALAASITGLVLKDVRLHGATLAAASILLILWLVVVLGHTH